MLDRLKMSMGILWAHMERLERNVWIGVLNWLSLSILVLLGLCANNQMLHTQWYWFFIFPFYMTKMLQCMDSQKIKCCNIIICVYFNLAKKCVYIYILLLFSLFLSSLHIFMQINTCNGWYCDQFTPNSPNSPKIWTENWTGWYIFLLFSLIYNIYIYIYIGFLITLHLRIKVQGLGLKRST